MIYKTAHYPRKVLEQMQLVNPECWAVYYNPVCIEDDITVGEIRMWAESHHYGRFIMLLHRNLNNYVIEFEREQEYTEFVLRWM